MPYYWTEEEKKKRSLRLKRLLATRNRFFNMLNASAGGAPATEAFGLVDQWIASVDGAVPNVEFTGLSLYTEIIVVAMSVTKSVSGLINLRASIDGSNYLSTSGDYVSVSDAGADANTDTVNLHSTNATALRTGGVWIGALNLTTPKWIFSVGRPDVREHYMPTTSPILAVRVYPSAGGNFTGGSIYCFGRM